MVLALQFLVVIILIAIYLEFKNINYYIVLSKDGNLYKVHNDNFLNFIHKNIDRKDMLINNVPIASYTLILEEEYGDYWNYESLVIWEEISISFSFHKNIINLVRGKL